MVGSCVGICVGKYYMVGCGYLAVVGVYGFVAFLLLVCKCHYGGDTCPEPYSDSHFIKYLCFTSGGFLSPSMTFLAIQKLFKQVEIL